MEVSVHHTLSPARHPANVVSVKQKEHVLLYKPTAPMQSQLCVAQPHAHRAGVVTETESECGGSWHKGLVLLLAKKERIFIELMTSDRKLKAPREGSK